MTEEEVQEIIERFDSDQEFRVSLAFLDGGPDPPSARLHRAALNQLCDGEATVSRYAIWANTVRDNIRQADLEIKGDNLAEAHRLLHRAANSLSAFSELQAAFLATSEVAHPEITGGPGGTVYTSKVTQEFLAKLPRLEKGFEAGGNFLRRLADNREEGFWLSTAQNAHLYYKDGYYAYLKPAKFEIELYAQYNSHIHQDTEDKSHLLFGAPLKALIIDLGGFKDKWVGGIPGGYVLKNTTPPQFFERLLGLIRESHDLDAAR